jgi:hypothetical protein
MEIVDVRVVLLKSNPPQLVVDVIGKVNSSGWRNARLEPRFYIGGHPADGVQDFDFIADPPTDIVMWVISPVRASVTIQGGLPPSYRGIRVHSATNSIEKALHEDKVESYVF